MLKLIVVLAVGLLVGCAESNQTMQTPTPLAGSASTPQRVFSPTTWKDGQWPFSLKEPAMLVVNGRTTPSGQCIATASDPDGNIYTLNGIAAAIVSGPNVYNIDKITRYEIGGPGPILAAALAICEKGNT